MKLSISCCALAVVMLASASLAVAKEYEFAFSGGAACPGGNCGPGGRHGRHGGGDGVGCMPNSGYPNGVDNYGIDQGMCHYRGCGGCRTGAVGNCQYRWYGQPDLFYNHYAWPSCSGVGAELYLSPRPVPPHVGHTYITYQPLMPHEFMYSHHRTYHRYYNGGQGLNRTHVKWYSPLIEF